MRIYHIINWITLTDMTPGFISKCAKFWTWQTDFLRFLVNDKYIRRQWYLTGNLIQYYLIDTKPLTKKDLLAAEIRVYSTKELIIQTELLNNARASIAIFCTVDRVAFYSNTLLSNPTLTTYTQSLYSQCIYIYLWLTVRSGYVTFELTAELSVHFVMEIVRRTAQEPS